MKKLSTLLTAAALILISSTGCTKAPKQDIVKYTVNGKSYEVTGAYSDMDFKGISKIITDFSLGFSAYNSSNMCGINCGQNFQYNLETNFQDYDNTFQKPCMIFEMNRSLPNRKVYTSINNRSGSYIITKNTTDFLEGNFSGWLYYMGMFGDEPISDSVEITNGYFYLTK